MPLEHVRTYLDQLVRQEKEPVKTTALSNEDNRIINETLTASFNTSVDLTPTSIHNNLDLSQASASTRSDSGSPEPK